MSQSAAGATRVSSWSPIPQFENVSGDAIAITTTGTGRYGYVSIVDDQFGLYSNSSGRIVNITAASTGGIGSSGGIGSVILANLIAFTDGTARAAISLTKTDNTILSGITLSGFNAYYTSSGDTNTRDYTGGIAAGVAVTGTPTTGQVPTATSGTAATWQTPTVPTPVTGVGTYGLLVEDGVTAPPVTLYTEDGTDWLYADG